MVYFLIAFVVAMLAAIVAWDIWWSKQKRKAPRADVWIGPIGLSSAQSDKPSYPGMFTIADLWLEIEAFTGKALDNVVLVLRPNPIPLPGGGTAAGVYHSTAKGWDHAWIELYSWEALPHELLHHATGLEDTPEFRELLQRFEATRAP
jgi:hypothetical protein